MAALLDEEYAIYRAILGTTLFRFDQRCTFSDTTGTSPRFSSFPDRWSAPFTGEARYLCARHPEILSDFTRKNASPGIIESRFLEEHGHQLLSERRRRAPQDKSGFFLLSRVGFTREGLLAMVYLEYSSHSGSFLLFQKNEARWTLVQSSCVWIV